MTSLPLLFVKQMHELMGEDAEALCSALEGDAPTTIRLAQRRPYDTPLLPNDAECVPWCPWGYYLAERPTFTGDPALHGGGYYVQEASSMLLWQIGSLLPSSPIIALDLCAAPGGKSTLLTDLLPEGSTLISNEYVHHRANILCENLQKWGSPYSIVTNTSADRLGALSGIFDLIVVDAPCSGEGMFRKDHEARSQWTTNAPKLCAERQREILSDIWHALKPGALLVYSTCTFNRVENEDVLDWLVTELGAESLALEHCPIPTSPYSTHPCYRMMPHQVKGEGLFMAVVRKPLEAHTPQLGRIKSKGKLSASLPIPAEMRGWINAPRTWQWEQDSAGHVRVYPEGVALLLHHLRALGVTILSAGIQVGEVKGKSCIPHPALAHSWVRHDEAFERIEVDTPTAIRYLAREAIMLSSSLSIGIKLIISGGVPLGFVKHLGNRTNNLYPNEWRIRHAQRLLDD